MKRSSDPTMWTIKDGDPTRLGVRQLKDGFNFAVVVENQATASLLFYQAGENEVITEIPLSVAKRIGNVSAVQVQGLSAGEYEYNYCINGKVVPDPYAQALTGRSIFGNRESNDMVRCCLPEQQIVQQAEVDVRYQDMVLYKLHVRGYTSQKNAKVKHKGTFRGLQQKIPYLKELGITSVELMPVYDFEECAEIPYVISVDAMVNTGQMEVPKLNYWGYTGGFYFAPKAAFCASGDPVTEFREMVAAFHQAGIEVLMELYFAKETCPSFIIEVLHFWKLHYAVDGFHLLGELPIEMIAKDALLQNTKLMYYGFNAEQIYQNGIPSNQNKVLAEYNLGYLETMRRFLKGDEDQVEKVIQCMRKNSATSSVINYIVSQDGFTLNDLVSYDYRHNEDNEENNRDGSVYNYSWNCGVEGVTRKISVLELRRKQMRNSMLLMMLCQGVPMIYGGDEIANSQNGNNNAYCQDNPIGWVDWSNRKDSREMLAFTKKVVAFRQRHRILHVEHEVRDTDYRALGVPEISFHSKRAWVPNLESTSRQLGVMYSGAYANEQEPAEYLYLAFNMHWEEQEFALPKIPGKMQWFLAINSEAKGSEGIYEPGYEIKLTDQKHIQVPSRTIVVLIGKQVIDDRKCVETL